MSLDKGHLQVLTPKVIDHESINKIFDRSLKPLSRCAIQSEAIVIDRHYGYKTVIDHYTQLEKYVV
jgi:hypothetical protein